jgi:nitrogen fixation protein NifU and related proteins
MSGFPGKWKLRRSGAGSPTRTQLHTESTGFPGTLCGIDKRFDLAAVNPDRDRWDAAGDPARATDVSPLLPQGAWDLRSTTNGQVLRHHDGPAALAPQWRGYGACRPDRACGDAGAGAFPILSLRVDGGQVTAAKYHTIGCGPPIACGSMLSELVLGRSIAECRELTAEDLIEALDGVPPDELHCPALAIGALRDALSHWEQRGDF